eukprot:13788812-Ditylum_brightwellii.AAC.1
MKDNIVYQENESAIWLEKNGKGSSSKRTRHIDIRYFFVTDRIAASDLTIEYYPTGIMIGEFFTKALQGKAFRTFKDMVMNIDIALAREVPLIVQPGSNFSDDVSSETQQLQVGFHCRSVLGKLNKTRLKLPRLATVYVAATVVTSMTMQE